MLLKNISGVTINMNHPDTGEPLVVAPDETVDFPRWYAQNVIPPRKKNGDWQRAE